MLVSMTSMFKLPWELFVYLSIWMTATLAGREFKTADSFECSEDDQSSELVDWWHRIDEAAAGIGRAARMLSTLPQENTECNALGGEFWILSNYVRNTLFRLKDTEEDSDIVKRVEGLFQKIEAMLQESDDVADGTYSRLWAISTMSHNSLAYKSEQFRLQSLFGRMIELGEQQKILDLQNSVYLFTRSVGITSDNGEWYDSKPRAQPAGFPSWLQQDVYKALQQNMGCRCLADHQNPPRSHPLNFLLQRVQQATKDRLARFEMLIGSEPGDSVNIPQKREECSSRHTAAIAGCWQDVYITASMQKSPLKYSDQSAPHVSLTSLPEEQLVSGERDMCAIISQHLRARLRFSVRDQKIYRFRNEPMQKRMRPVQGIPLAAILGDLTNKMKVCLAFILAQAVWHYYESEWTDMQWTTDTIHLMTSFTEEATEESEILVYRPYLVVQFGDTNPRMEEHTNGELLHPYRKIFCLGILLLEIGLGSKLPRDSAGTYSFGQANDEWEIATALANTGTNIFDHDRYWVIVQACLNYELFHQMNPRSKSDGTYDFHYDVVSRRKTLYERVVSPLEEMLNVNGWASYLDSKERFIPRARKTVYTNEVEPKMSSLPKGILADRWLGRLEGIREEMMLKLAPPMMRYPRVQIVLLDTGYEPKSSFLDDGNVRDRLQKPPVWKDFAESSETAVDSDGHGTHLLSLIMRIAPYADLHVARVAKNSKNLKQAQENVAKAIRWAVDECAADVISMSFGFSKEHPTKPVTGAIESVLYELKRKVVFFASANNEGTNEAETCPASHKDVIAIRATGDKGEFLALNAPKQARDGFVLGTLGLDVLGADRRPDLPDRTMSGTSVATAIAAGIAGILLTYVNRNIGGKKQAEVKKLLLTEKGMSSMLQSLSTETKTAHHYFAPWAFEGKDKDACWSLFTRLVDYDIK